MSDAIPRLRELLGEAGARLGMDRAAEAGALWSRWEEVVGPAIAEHAEPTSLRKGLLKIRTDSASWATELAYMKEQVMSAANALLGEGTVSDVQVWTGPGPIRRKRVEGPSRPTAPDPSRGSDEDRALAPEAALERARAAWQKRRSAGPRRDLRESPRKPENPW